MGRTSKRKGRAGELELAKLLRGYGYDVEPGRAVSFGTVPDLTGLPGVHIECKRRENLNLCAALDQAAEDATYFEDGLPTIFHRHNREGWVVSMRLDDWMTLYRQAKSRP